MTGPSGSGKSSLAFHTLYAEGQRCYVETFSPYTRQFFDRMDRPAVDSIKGIPPAIAIEQRNNIRTSRSTVGTLTELNDYLKVLYPAMAVGKDPETGEVIEPATAGRIIDWLLKQWAGKRVLICFSVPLPHEGEPSEWMALLRAQGYLRILGADGQILRSDKVPGENSQSLLTLKDLILIVQDRAIVEEARRPVSTNQ